MNAHLHLRPCSLFLQCSLPLLLQVSFSFPQHLLHGGPDLHSIGLKLPACGCTQSTSRPVCQHAMHLRHDTKRHLIASKHMLTTHQQEVLSDSITCIRQRPRLQYQLGCTALRWCDGRHNQSCLHCRAHAACLAYPTATSGRLLSKQARRMQYARSVFGRTPAAVKSWNALQEGRRNQENGLPSSLPHACNTVLRCNHAACAARRLSRSCSACSLCCRPMRAPHQSLLHG